LKKEKERQVIGWREWVSLPKIDVHNIKVKVDTGARTSSLHAFDIQTYKRNGKEFAKFKVHPTQKNSKDTVICHSQIIEYRKVKSSNGSSESRPVIETEIELMGQKWLIEITLTNRDEMGFRMLLGRASFRDRFLVDANKSYYSDAKTNKKRDYK
jgi:hypothetical protein